MSSWTIIGGGIHAVTIAIKLRSLGLDCTKLTIIDPHTNLCEQFDHFTKSIDMPYLRSPCVHHVHPDPFHLKQYGKKKQYTHASYGPYKRPNRDIFMEHTHDLIHSYNLNDCHVQGTVSQIKRVQSQWHILCHNQWIKSTHLVIAFGCNHDPFIPELFHNQPDVTYIFQNEHCLTHHASHIIGSGISAAHLTLKLLKKNNTEPIHLWMKKDITIHDFDADPGWLGPKNIKYFSQMTSSKARFNLIKQERHKGSMPKELELRLKKYIAQGRLIIHKNEITDIANHAIHTKQYCMYYDHLLLATGFKESIMQQPVIKQLVDSYQAPITHCGLPSINANLEWLPNLFVSGGLADLELGPFARNIMGGREAALRISEVYEKTTSNDATFI